MKQTLVEVEKIYADIDRGPFSKGIQANRVFKFIKAEIDVLCDMSPDLVLHDLERNRITWDDDGYWEQEGFVKRLLGIALRDKLFLGYLDRKKFCEMIGWCGRYRPEALHTVLRIFSESYVEDKQ